MLTKICGIADGENAVAVAALGPDFMGFIFHESSPRFVDGRLDSAIVRRLPPSVAKVGVFVDAPIERVSSTVDRFGLDVVQLHGSESPDYLGALRAAVPGAAFVKSFGISDRFDFESVRGFESCDFLLFDTATSSHGGSGRRFDWELLRSYPLKVPFFLSGGLGCGSAAEINAGFFAGLPLAGIDFNSKLETEPGVKDVALCSAALEEVRYEFTR